MGLEVSFADLHDTTTFFSGNFDVSSVFVTICCALSIYNGLELLLLVFTTFRRFQGLYFWSLVIASFGLLPYTVGVMIMYFTFTNSGKFCHNNMMHLPSSPQHPMTDQHPQSPASSSPASAGP